MDNKKSTFINSMMNPLKYGMFTLRKLPSLLFWGIKVTEINELSCTVTTKYNWRNTNPFGSMYFSALCGSGELATGILVMLNTFDNGAWSMLVTGFESQFKKKAMGKIKFICEQGEEVAQLIDSMKAQKGNTGNIVLKARAIDEQGDEVASFNVHWSLKYKG